MEQPFGTFKNNTVSERFRKMGFCYLTPSLCTQKWWQFWNISERCTFVTLLPPPTTAPQTETRYLINRTSERFGKITLLLPYSSPLHCTPKVTLAISKIEHPNVCKDTLSLPYTLPPAPPHCTPKWPSLSHKLIIWKFRKDTLSLPYSSPPPHCTPRMTLVISYIEHHKTPSYMEQPFGTFKNNTVSERFRKMCLCYLTPSLCTQKWWQFWNISERCTFVTLLPPPPLHPKLTLAIL